MIFEHFTQLFSCNVVVYYFNVPIYITFKINMVIYLDYKDLYELSRFLFAGKDQVSQQLKRQHKLRNSREYM